MVMDRESFKPSRWHLWGPIGAGLAVIAIPFIWSFNQTVRAWAERDKPVKTELRDDINDFLARAQKDLQPGQVVEVRVKTKESMTGWEYEQVKASAVATPVPKPKSTPAPTPTPREDLKKAKPHKSVALQDPELIRGQREPLKRG